MINTIHDLSIGGLVKYKHEVVPVVYLEATGIVGVKDPRNLSQIERVPLKALDGVEITAEWLERLGFTNYEVVDVLDHLVTECSYTRTDGLSVYWATGHYCFGNTLVEHVHHLQNLALVNEGVELTLGGEA